MYLRKFYQHVQLVTWADQKRELRDLSTIHLSFLKVEVPEWIHVPHGYIPSYVLMASSLWQSFLFSLWPYHLLFLPFCSVATLMVTRRCYSCDDKLYLCHCRFNNVPLLPRSVEFPNVTLIISWKFQFYPLLNNLQRNLLFIFYFSNFSYFSSWIPITVIISRIDTWNIKRKLKNQIKKGMWFNN